MRIIHFADLHIGVENYGRPDPESGLSTRLMDFLNSLDQLVEFAMSQDVDLVLLAGDAYKSRDPNQTQQRELARRLSKLSSANIPVFLLVGNHDLPYGMGRATAIEIFNTLNVPNLYVGDQVTTYNVDTQKGPLQIVALPWPRRSRLLTRDDIRGLSMEQINQRIETLLTHGVKMAADGLDPDIPAILAGHVTVSGASLGSERSMMLGQDHVLLPSNLHLPSFDYIALGHIHKHQIIRENPLMVYSGSLQRVDFGEEGDAKGFCVVDFDTSQIQGKRLVNFRFQEVTSRNFMTVNIDVPNNSNDPTLDIIDSLSRHHINDSIVRVKIALTSPQSTAIRERDIQEVLKHAHFVASITYQVEDGRRSRIPADTVEDLSPLKALGLYLESRNIEEDRKVKLLQYAQKLMEKEIEGHVEEPDRSTPQNDLSDG